MRLRFKPSITYQRRIQLYKSFQWLPKDLTSSPLDREITWRAPWPSFHLVIITLYHQIFSFCDLSLFNYHCYCTCILSNSFQTNPSSEYNLLLIVYKWNRPLFSYPFLSIIPTFSFPSSNFNPSNTLFPFGFLDCLIALFFRFFINSFSFS